MKSKSRRDYEQGRCLVVKAMLENKIIDNLVKKEKRLQKMIMPS